MASLQQFPQFNVHAEWSTSTHCKKWKDILYNLLVAMNITHANRQKTLLLHYAGEEVHDIFNTLTLAPHVGEGDLDLYKQASDALNDYFIPKKKHRI